MITDQFTKTQFVVEVLNRDITNIYRAQQLIVEKNIRLTGKNLKEKKRSGTKIGTRSGRLLESLQNPQFAIAAGSGKLQAQSYIPLHARFLDMKEKGNWMIYNRQVWGILYGRSIIDVKYGYGEQLRDTLGEALNQAFNK